MVAESICIFPLNFECGRDIFSAGQVKLPYCCTGRILALADMERID